MTDDLAQAVAKFRRLEEEQRALHRALIDLSERRREARAELQRLRDQLHELGRYDSTAADRQSIEGRIDRQRAEVERLEDRESEQRSRWEPLATLVARAKTFLETNAALEELELGFAHKGKPAGGSHGIADT